MIKFLLEFTVQVIIFFEQRFNLVYKLKKEVKSNLVFRKNKINSKVVQRTINRDVSKIKQPNFYY
jgi:hypothetical protein